MNTEIGHITLHQKSCESNPEHFSASSEYGMQGLSTGYMINIRDDHTYILILISVECYKNKKHYDGHWPKTELQLS